MYLKILYVGDSTHIHDFRFIEKLVENGYDTNVLTINNNPVKLKGAKYYAFPQEFNDEGNRFVNNVKYIKYIYEPRKYIKKLIKEIEPDILHGGWIPQHGFISALSGFHPFLLMPWGSDILVIPQNASYLTKKQIVWTIRKADMITCDAEYVKNEIIRLSGYPKDKIVVFPWGIDLKKFNPHVNGDGIRESLGWEDKTVIIITRSLTRKIYGVKYFLRSLPKLIKNNNNIRVLFCGDGPLRSDFERYVYENRLGKYVHFAGHVENDDLPRYLAAADIYVSTSLSDGTSLSLLEAMAVGLPCVVTDIPAIREWITDGHNGFLVPKEDAYAVYEKLDLLLNNDDLRETFGMRNSKIAENRADWDKNFKKLEEIYNKLLTSH